MRPVIIESPFKGINGDYDSAKVYLEECVRDYLSKNETPYASHKMIPGALDDTILEERQLGIKAGQEMAIILLSTGMSGVVIYTDLGISEGMQKSIDRYKFIGFSNYLEYRKIR